MLFTIVYLFQPPTTTKMRIKSLMTGCMPNFIDAFPNFHNMRLFEDNVLKQAKKNNKSIYFVGDSSWADLFPRPVISPNRQNFLTTSNLEDIQFTDNLVRENLMALLTTKGNDDDDEKLGYCNQSFREY